METPLYQFKDNAQNFEERTKSITEEINRFDKDLTELTFRIEKIDSQVAGYNRDLVRNWYKERTKFEEIRDSNQQNLGAFRIRMQEADDHYKKCEDGLRENRY